VETGLTPSGGHTKVRILPTETSQEMETSRATCVADIRQLCVEFQQAIAALASDDLPALEAGIENQDQLASKLQDWFRAQPASQPTQIKINRTDLRELVNLTRVYSALLTKSTRTVRLRSALCRTYQQQFSSTIAQTENASSLSFEV
jgi:hypothetical protein